MIRRRIDVLFCVYCLTGSVVGQNFVNVAIGKNCSQSSTFNRQWLSSNVANSNTGGTLNTDNCIHTLGGRNEWWEVDLGRTYPVHDITVWARTGFIGRAFPSTITVDNQTCVSVTSVPRSRNKSVRCSSVMYGQVVRLTYNGEEYALNMCEFQIFVPSGISQCPAGHHGAQCGLTCSDNCGGGPGKNFCYQDTGVCYDGCTGNFAGNMCTDCDQGYYKQGIRCQECSSDCRNRQCNKDTGKCKACPDGWYGNLCAMTCSPGCARCDQQSGNCTVCATNSHLLSPGCTECEDGYYKQSAPTCIQCPGTCYNNTPCDKTTGHCEDCPPGMNGDMCNQEKPANQNDSLSIPVVSSVIVAGVIIAIAVVGSVCWYRRSRRGPAAKRDTRSTVNEPVNALGDNGTESLGRQPPSSPSPQDDAAYYEISDTANTHEMREVQNDYDVLNPYSNADADRQPYSQIVPHSSDVTKTSANAAYVNTAFHNVRGTNNM